MNQPTEYTAGLKIAIKLAEDRIEIANMLHSGDKNNPIFKAFIAGIEDVLVSLRGSAARSEKGEDYRLLLSMKG